MSISITSRVNESRHIGGRSGNDVSKDIDETKAELILDGGAGIDGVGRSSLFLRTADSQFGEHVPAREFTVVGETPAALAGRVTGMVAISMISPSEITKQPADRTTNRSGYAKLSEISSVQRRINDSAAVTFKSGREVHVSQPDAAILALI